MAIINKIKAVAEAIRQKTGTTGEMTLADMPSKIAGIKTTPILQEKSVQPTNKEQVVTADAPNDGLSKVTVHGVQLETLTATDNGTYVPSDGKYFSSVSISVQNEPSPVLQSKSVTPTESQAEVVADSGYDGLDKVTVAPISSTYVGSGVTKRSSTSLTVSGATVTAPAGYYSSGASKSVASGTAGTPSASKGSVKDNSIEITPTVTNSTGYITGGTKTGTKVTVSASDLVSGSQTITGNGTFDVTNLASVLVNVASSGGGGSLPSGISAFDYGSITVSSAFTTSRKTFSHKLGVTPDLVIVYAPANVAQTYSMLAAMRGNVLNWRSGYNSHYAYHGNSNSTVTWANSNNASYGVSNMTATSFQLASHSTSYYWRTGTYNYIAIKFS